MRSKSVICLLALAFTSSAQEWQRALPSYQYVFPQDHFSHPNYRNEWWYYTGNLRAADGHRFGFELTFFRQGVHMPKSATRAADGVWLPDQIYLAHFALSDIDRGEFHHAERLNRSGPGLAGAALDQQRYWNGNWQVHWTSLVTGEQQLQAVCNRFTLLLDLKPAKPFVINGVNGVNQKGPRPGDASHYISFTRLETSGELHENRTVVKVTGFSWMDHEFFTGSFDESLTGWDWFAVQLNNNEELMLYRLRNESGQQTSYSSGTYVDSQGRAHFLNAQQFSLSPGETWLSPVSRARYPVGWHISIPSLQLDLSEHTDLKNQELYTKSRLFPNYWEGAVTYEGRMHSKPIHGVGYLEMTGYIEPFHL